MLRLLKNSQSLELYADYFDAFAKTRQGHDDKNDHIKIGKVFREIEFLFVDGRNLIATKNDNTTPFAEGPRTLFMAPKYDRFSEGKATLGSIARSLSDWLYSVLESGPSLRLVVLDLSSRKYIQEFCDMEVEMTMSSALSREEMLGAPTRVYVNIAVKAAEQLKNRLENSDTPLKDSVKLIFHFGGTLFSPMIFSAIRTEKGIVTNTLAPYYVTPADQKRNDWMARYSFSADNTGFFADLMARPENSRWKKIMLFTFDHGCFASLCRSMMEIQELYIHVYLMDSDGETIFADADKLKQLLFHVMASQFDIPGRSVEYLSDLYALEILSDFYDDIDSLLEDYRVQRGAEPLYSVSWREDLAVSFSDSSAAKFEKMIQSRMESVSIIRKKLGLTLLMADLVTILESPVPVSEPWIAHGKGRTEWYSQALTSCKMWLAFQYLSIDLRVEKKIYSALYQGKNLVFVSYLLIYLYPHLHQLWNEQKIATINDVIDYVSNSDNLHAKNARALLTADGYKIMFAQEEDDAREDGPEDLPKDEVEFTEKIDYQAQFLSFLRQFDQHWNKQIWDNDSFSEEFLLNYSPNAHELLRSMFSRMGKKRVDYMEQRGLISRTKGGIRFNLDEEWTRPPGKSLQEVGLNRMLYQIARKFPHSWSRWVGPSSLISSEDYSELVAVAIASWQSKRKPEEKTLPAADTASIPDYGAVNPMFKWKALPIDVPADVAKMLLGATTRGTEGWKIPDRPIRWKILKALVPSRIQKPRSSAPVNREEYSILLAKIKVDDGLLEGWLYRFDRIAVSNTRPSVGYIRDYFHPMLPHLLRDIFLCGVPSDCIGLNALDTVRPELVSLVASCQVKSELLDLVLSLEMFSTRENFTIYDLGSFLKAVMFCKATWKSDKSGAVTNLMLLMRYLIYDKEFIGRENLKKHIELLSDEDTEAKLVNEIMKQLASSPGAIVPKQTLGFGRLLGANLMMNDLKEEIGFQSITNLIGYILQSILQSELWTTKSPKKIVDFMVRMFYMIGAAIVMNSIDQKTTYDVAVEFSFDVYQPKFQTARESLLLLRLYEIENMSDEAQDESVASFLDFDTNVIQLEKYKRNYGIGPVRYETIRDPVDNKNYLCLAWDYEEFSKSIGPYQATFYTENAVKSDAKNFVGLLEIYAAHWWLSVPEFRAKVRSRAGSWNSVRWATWLLTANAEGKLEHVTLDPLVQSCNRYKVFQIPPEANILPCNDLMAEEFGMGYVQNIANLAKLVFENNNFLHYAVTLEQVEGYKKDFRRLSLPEEQEPASAKNVFDPVRRTDATEGDDGSGCSTTYGYFDHTAPGILNAYRADRMLFVSRSNVRPLVTREFYDPKTYSPGDRIPDIVEKWIPIISEEEKRHGVPEERTFVYECTLGISDFLEGLNADPHLTLVRETVASLPHFYGIYYKFYVYVTTPKRYKVVSDGLEAFISYDDFRNADTSKDSYHVGISYNISEAKPVDIILQGVYGNSVQKDTLYSLFHYAQLKLKNDRTHRTGSYIRDQVQFSGLRTKDVQEFWLARTLNFKDIMDVQGSEYADVMMRTWNRKTIDAVASLKTEAEYHEEGASSHLFFGFTKKSTWLRRYRQFASSWFLARNIPERIYLASGEDIMEIYDIIKRIEEKSIVSFSGLPQGDALTVCCTPNVLLSDKKEVAARIARDTLADVYRLMQVQSHCLADYRTLSKKNTRDLFFVAQCIDLFDTSKYSFIIPTVPIIYYRSEKTTQSLVRQLTGQDIKATEEQMKELYEELESLEGRWFLMINGEESFARLEDILTVRLRDGVNYFDEVEALKETIRIGIDEDLSYLFLSVAQVGNTEMYNSLIQEAPRKKLMASVIHGVTMGGLSFLTSNQEYDALGIDVGATGMDSGVLWETLEERLSEEQQALFGDPQQTDGNLRRLEEQIKQAKGAIAVSKRKAYEKIIRELRDGRKVMLYLAESEEPPESDRGLFELVYRIMDERSPLKKKSIHQLGSNKFEIERNMRLQIDEALKQYGVQLIFTGEYAPQSDDEPAVPKKSVRKKYKTGLTVYMNHSKKKSSNIKTGVTFAEAIIVSMYYALNRGSDRMKYFMNISSFDDIKKDYENVTFDDQGSIVDRIDTQGISEIFSDRFTDSMEKAKRAFRELIASKLDISIRIFRISVSNAKVAVLPPEVLEGGKMEISMINVVRTKGKGTAFFEPLMYIE
jgi:hypothetical protein